MKARRVAALRIRNVVQGLLHESFGDAHEGGFEVDFFFFDAVDLVAGVDELRGELGDEAWVGGEGGVEGDVDLAVGRFGFVDAGERGEQRGGLGVSVEQAHVQDGGGADLGEQFVDASGELELALFEDADDVAEVCEFEEDV